MFSSTKFLTLTFLVCSAIASAHIHQPNHANLKRLIKKRSPLPQDTPLSVVAGAGAAVPTIFPSTTVTSTSSDVSSTSISTSTSLTSSTSTSESLSASSLISASSSVGESSLSASDSSTSLSVSSTVSSSTSTSTTTTQPTAPTTTEAPAVTSATTPTTTLSKSIVTLTKSVDASETATVLPEVAAAAAAPKSTAITALIIAASSIAGITILWTIFRKWKLGRSTKFDERLQPIDWRPTNDDDEALPGHHRRHSGASSFRSAGHLGSAGGHGSSDHGHDSPSSYALPDHDFTAGPTHLAPIGGYADLARGPSPQPQMNQMGGGISLSRPAYDVGVPLHHQGYDSRR